MTTRSYRTRMTLNRGDKPEKHVSSQNICKILDACASCPNLSVHYNDECIGKTEHFKNLLKEEVLFSKIPVRDCEASPKRLAYRHMAKCVVAPDKHHDDGVRIGLYQPRTHEVIDIGNCPVQVDLINKLTFYFRKHIVEHGLAPYDEKKKTGLLRYILIRVSKDGKQASVTFVVTADATSQLKNFARDIRMRFTAVRGVMQHVNASSGNEIISLQKADTDSEQNEGLFTVLSGSNYIEDLVGGLKLRVSSGSFSQVNPYMAEIIYQRISDLVTYQKPKGVLDLYCGTGSIALQLANKVPYVIGIEENPVAVEDAKINATVNGLPNSQFIQGRTEDVIANVLASDDGKDLDVVTLNPSRRGCQPEVLDAVAKLNPKAIVYMSCHPVTLIRDLKTLVGYDYRPKFFELFDMFPGTPHYEVLALITRK